MEENNEQGQDSSRYTGALAVGIAACGASVVQGKMIDSLITANGDCAGNVTPQVVLTSASGQVIARDDNAPFQWVGRACEVPFSFSDVPDLAGYGIRVVGLGTGTTWLTPAQGDRPVTLTLGPGFAVSGCLVEFGIEAECCPDAVLAGVAGDAEAVLASPMMSGMMACAWTG